MTELVKVSETQRHEPRTTVRSRTDSKYYSLCRPGVRRWRGGGGSGFSFKVYVSVKERLQVPRFIVFFQVTGLYFFQVTGFREGFQGLRDGITRKQLAYSTATSNELIQDSEK